MTLANSSPRFDLFALAGTEQVRVEGEAVVGRWAEGSKLFRIEESHNLHVEFANSRNDSDGIVRFTRRYGPLDIEPSPATDFRFRLDRWPVGQRLFRHLWEQRSKSPTAQIPQLALAGLPPVNHWQYETGRVLYRTANLWEYLLVTLLASPGDRLRMCARPGCLHLYFIAAHLKQNFCSEPCAAWGQREWKRNWWVEHGKEWRRKRSKRNSKRRK
jgi:hypothetical protein